MTVTEYIEKKLNEGYGIKFPKDIVDRLSNIIAASQNNSDYIEASKLLYQIYKDYKDKE